MAYRNTIRSEAWWANAIYATTGWTTEWRADYFDANAPGLPSAHDSISTTRITLPENLPPDTGRVDTQRISLEHPHWPLVFMLVVTQLSVGAFAVLAMLDLLGSSARLSFSALTSLALAGVSLAASTLHLGRPVYAWRALRGLRRSWLSREVLGLSAFAGAASLYAATLFFDLPGRALAGVLTVLCGAIGVTCSARIYMGPARPAWYSRYTMAEFSSTALLLGPLFMRAMNGGDGSWLVWAAICGGGAQLLTQSLKFLWLTRSDIFELRGSALLLSGRLRWAFLLRLGLLIAAGIALPLSPGRAPAFAAFLIALFGEWLGRWLFFVSVVPKSIASTFTAAGKRAA